MATDLRAIRVAACYLLLGIGWILFSDQLLMALVADLETFARIGRYKGLCFVALTTVLIYGLLRHAPPPRPVPAGSPWPLLALFVALALAIVAVGANQVREARASRQAASMADLRAVSRLKRQEVADWLAVRARETASLRDSIDLPHGWPGGPAAAVSARLQALGRTFGAKGIWLVDADGRVLAGQAGDEPPADAGWRDLLRQAGSGGMPHSGLFKHAQRWHIDFAVALTPAAGGPPVFAVVRFDPADSLFAHFGDWPLPSTSAEVLLFRRAGDQVLVLNPVRYRRADAGAGFTLSLAAPELLSARALRGEIALGEPVEGIDYRGRPSVGVAQQVPGTHWFLLAKMDRSELFAGSERDIGRLVGSYLLVLLLAGAAAAYLYQRRGLAQAALLRQAQAERLRTLQLIDAIAAASSDAIFAKDREGRYILANAATCRALGLGESQIVGHLDEELFPPEYAAAFVADDRAVMASGQSRTYEEAVSTPAGVRTYMTTKGPLCDPDGTVRGIYAITRDITERKEAEAQLAQAAMVVSSTQDGVMVTDARGRILHVNQAFSVITGYREDEIRGQTARVLHSGRQTEADYAAMWQTLIATGSWQGEIWNRRKNGEIFPEWLSINAVRDADGQAAHYVGVFTDISRLKRSEAELARLAEYDPLTDLPNRRQVNLRLQGALQRCQRHGSRLAVLYLDLDHFKNINDSLGHHAGDELLLGVAARLRARLREEDLFGRLGGDEFLVLLEGLEQPERAAVVARDLLAALTAPFLLDGRHEVYATGSIGISIYPEDGCEDGELLRNADTAMYRAKAQGRNQFCFYTGEMNAEAQARLALEAAMRHALERGEFQLYYQPKVEAGSGRIAGAEALLRWLPHEGGAVPPATFIPLAEQCGLIGEIGRWVIDRACADLSGWRAQGLPVVPVAVNVSARQFMSGEVETVVAEALARHGVTADQIELELTESVLMERPEAAAATLRALKAAGLRLALDDFGTGYSSLSYLMRFPMDVLKIDQTFVRELVQRPGAAMLAGAVIGLAHRMGMEVVAEGVETREQLDFLREQGCELIQGYYFSRPLPADDFAVLLRDGLPALPAVEPTGCYST